MTETAAPRFSPPQRLAVGPTLIDRRPALAISGSSAFIAAGLGLRGPARSPSLAAGDTANLLLAGVPGMPGSRPPGEFAFRFPRAAFDSGGVLHLVWGETAQPGAGEDAAAPRIGTLWHARFEGGRWTTPARIYEAQEIMWDPAAGSSLVADARGRLYVVVPAWLRDGSWALAYLRASGGEWMVSDVHPAAPAAYADVAVGPSGQVALVYAAGYSGRGASYANALFSVVSPDGGSAWGAHTPFGEPDRWPASGVRASYTRDGTLHVVWMQREAGGMDIRALWHAASRDGGRTWSDFASVALEGFHYPTQAAVSGAGEIHFITTRYLDRHADLVYARYRTGRWTAPVPLFPARLGAEPTLRIDPRDRLHLVWIAQPEGVAVPLNPAPGDTIPWFELAYSTAEAGTR